MGYKLKVIKGFAKDKVVSVETNELTIGRTEENILVVFDPSVSRKHAVIKKEGTVFKIIDRGSRNGTLLNGSAVIEEILKDGDTFTIGNTTFRFGFTESLSDQINQEHTQILSPPPKKSKGKLGNPSPKSEITHQQSPSFATQPSKKLKSETEAQGSDSKRRLLPKVLLITGTFFLILFVMFVIKNVFSGKDTSLKDHSSMVFDISATNFDKKFGYIEADYQCLKGCQFTFEPSDNKLFLSFSAYGIYNHNDVVIEINGSEIGSVPVTGKNLLRGISVMIPKELLTKDENLIVFKYKGRTDKINPWYVTFVKINQEVIPEPDLDKAKEFAELGYNKYREKNIEPRNLYVALSFFMQSKDYMEKLATKPQLYLEVQEQIKSINKELQAIYDKLMFSVSKAINDQDYKKAYDLLNDVLKYFPDPEDVRNKEARQMMQSLSEG
ncbi:MAG: FHA domain-containing protein [Deltaproteobacteria bacterium]|nr:FHA domain-containing protein [Deltaproteobacteria bacterium]